MRILVVDNFDSFTYNLLESFKLEGCLIDVIYNTVDPSTVDITKYDLLMLSPGPSNPKKSGFLLEFIEKFKYQIPIFGVCLGFQAIIESFDGKLGYLNTPVHGKRSSIKTTEGVFFKSKSKKNIARYHSIYAKEVSDEFQITGTTSDGIPMAIEHVSLPIYGVQFHPESILSMAENTGQELIQNLLNELRKQNVQNIA